VTCQAWAGEVLRSKMAASSAASVALRTSTLTSVLVRTERGSRFSQPTKTVSRSITNDFSCSAARELPVGPMCRRGRLPRSAPCAFGSYSSTPARSSASR
jgi:hypothetical protein